MRFMISLRRRSVFLELSDLGQALSEMETHAPCQSLWDLRNVFLITDLQKHSSQQSRLRGGIEMTPLVVTVTQKLCQKCDRKAELLGRSPAHDA